MIKEIVTFMETINPDSFKDQIPDGLHIMININENGNLIEKPLYEYYNKKLDNG